MTDITKYRNVSLTHETYKTLISLSKVLLPDAQLSISKTIESIANEKAKKLNGKIKKSYKLTIHICPTCKGNGYVKVASLEKDESQYINVGTVTRKGNYMMSPMIWVWIDDGTSDSLH